MLTEPLIQQLTQLRLHGMAAALEQQANGADGAARSFEDRLGLLIQNELTDTQSMSATHTRPTRRWAGEPFCERHSCQAPRGSAMPAASAWGRTMLIGSLLRTGRGW